MNTKKDIENIYLMGIGGSAMGSFAGLLKQAGFAVSGSDSQIYSPMADNLKKWHITAKTPYNKDNLIADCDLVIVGNVIKKDNPEAIRMRELGLEHISFPAALKSFFLKSRISTVISGTHGKTTCSALVAHTLKNCHQDPGWLIGGLPINLHKSFALGSTADSSPFVIEGDEYDTAYFDKRPKFLHYQPHHLLATSLEFDHADIYNNLTEIQNRFSELFNLVSRNGSIVAHHNDLNLKKALQNSTITCPLITYGDGGNYQAGNISDDQNGIKFAVYNNQQYLGEVQVPLNGNHNQLNCLGCYALLRQLGLSHQQIQSGFASFAGTKRRMEIVAKVDNNIIIDDFAHHPTSVATTIMAAKRKFPGKKIIALYEPGSATSCRNIFQDKYSKSFIDADLALIAPPKRSLKQSDRLDTEFLCQQISQNGTKAIAFDSNNKLLDYILDNVRHNLLENCLILCMSNNSFDNMPSKIAHKLKQKQ